MTKAQRAAHSKRIKAAWASRRKIAAAAERARIANQHVAVAVRRNRRKIAAATEWFRLGSSTKSMTATGTAGATGVRAARRRIVLAPHPSNYRNTTFDPSLGLGKTRERKPADPIAEALASLVAAVREQERAKIIAKLNEA